MVCVTAADTQQHANINISSMDLKYLLSQKKKLKLLHCWVLVLSLICDWIIIGAGRSSLQTQVLLVWIRLWYKRKEFVGWENFICSNEGTDIKVSICTLQIEH